MLCQWREWEQETAEHLWLRAVGEEEECNDQYFPFGTEQNTATLDLNHLSPYQVPAIIPSGIMYPRVGVWLGRSLEYKSSGAAIQ
ncbi:hypothetical protein AOLI_G00027790 [Acnodon oligacanthus]